MPSAIPSRCVPAALLMSAALILPAVVVAESQQSAAGATGTGSHPAGAGHPAGTSGSAGTGSGTGGGKTAAGGAAGAGATAGGEKLLQSVSPPCTTCHQVKAGVNQPAPSLAGIATRARQRVAATDYKGKARDAKAYIRESIMDPGAYIVPGQGYAVNGKSLMPATYAQALKPEQIEQMVNYLMSLK